MITGEIFTGFAKFQGIVSVNDQALLGLLREVFVFHGWDCNHCVVKSCTTTAYRWLLRDSRSFSENFVIRSYQITKIFRSGHDCTSTSSARSPRYFCLQADIAIWVFREVSVDTVLARARFHLCSRLLWYSWEDREVSWSISAGFPMALEDCIHRPNFLWNPAASPASHATDRFVLLRVLHFYFSFRFLLIYAACFPVTPHSYFHFFRLRDVSMYLQRSNTESCDEDVEEVDVDDVEELVDKPGTTNGT